jgi:GDP-fucose protein O-fucosyltransferase
LIVNYTKEGLYDPALPTVVSEREPLLRWARNEDSLTLQLSFHSIFRFQKALVEIGYHILDKLPHNFFGAHLRLEDDWVEKDVEIGMYTDFVLSHADKAEPVLMYVACGDVEKLQKFKQFAKNKGILVQDKWDLADENYKLRMKSMEFDRLALVDFVVLQHSQFFVGVTGSTFSRAVAQQRHAAQFGDLDYHGKDTQQYLIGGGVYIIMLKDRMW